MSDIEKIIESMIHDVGGVGREASRASGENLRYAIKYLMEFRHLGRENLLKRLLIIGAVAAGAAAIWFKSNELAAFLVEKSQAVDWLKVHFLQVVIGSPKVYQVIAVIGIPYAYLMAVGGRKKEEARQFSDKFELLGMTKQLNQFVIDENGNKRRLTVSPELIAEHKKNGEVTVRLFKTNGFPLDAWEKKRTELESSFNEPIYRLETGKGSLNVIKMVTVSEAYKEKLDEKYQTELEYNDVFEKIGLVGKGTREINHFGTKRSIKNYPEYMDTEIQQINGKNVQILKFKSIGTELSNWQASKFLMENVLNRLVVKIEQEKKNKQQYKVYTLDLADDLEELYDWKDDYVSDEDGVIILGEGLIGQVTLDLNKLPHVLIGGVTNFGKSVLSNCITWQMIKKGALVIPIDFKGGIELDMFGGFHEVIFDRKVAIKALEDIIKEYEARLKLIKSRKLKNISQFNKQYPDEALCRIVIVVDEIAEMLSGASSKSEANQIAILDDQLSTIARLARAVGIHLVLGTQRPDANVLQGQIKNNLPARICGRMIDKEPSLMILGTPDATRIPDIKGRFMFSLGSDVEIFQSYFFKESDIKSGYYVKGQCLVYENDIDPAEYSQSVKPTKRVALDDDFEPIDEPPAEAIQAASHVKSMVLDYRKKATQSAVSDSTVSMTDPTVSMAVDDDWLADQIGEPDEEEDEEIEDDDMDIEKGVNEDDDFESIDDQHHFSRSDSDESENQNKRRVEIL